MTQITEFIPQLQQVNVHYIDFMKSEEPMWREYCQIVDFYHTHQDVGAFEKMVLDILLEKDKHTAGLVLASLKNELDTNIIVYTKCKRFFDGIEADAISNDMELTYDHDVERLVREANSYGGELCEVIDMIDNKVEYSDSLTDNDLWDKYEMVLTQHRTITKQLYELYIKQEECKAEAAKYYENPFASLYDMVLHFRAIVEKYLPTEAEPKPKVEGAYFDMGTVSAIHKLCNNVQFETVSELDLYAILNLQPTPAKIVIKKQENIRVCYLIYKLYEMLQTPDKAKWRTEILAKAGISESYYGSKYKEPESDVPSKKSEQFAQSIKEILSK